MDPTNWKWFDRFLVKNIAIMVKNQKPISPTVNVTFSLTKSLSFEIFQPITFSWPTGTETINIKPYEEFIRRVFNIYLFNY